jgi:hypothetical protein
MESSFESLLQFLNLDATGRNEGLDDILQLNIGGKNYDLKRSVFTQADLGPFNLLSFLFNKRWERLLLRDKENRIYLDWNADWIQPILDQIIFDQLYLLCDKRQSDSSRAWTLPVSTSESLQHFLPLLNGGDYVMLEKKEKITGLTGSVLLDSPTRKSDLHRRLCDILGLMDCQFYLERMFLYNGNDFRLTSYSCWNRVGKKLLVGSFSNGIRATLMDASLSGASFMSAFHFSISKPQELYQITHEVQGVKGKKFKFPISFGTFFSSSICS